MDHHESPCVSSQDSLDASAHNASSSGVCRAKPVDTVNPPIQEATSTSDCHLYFNISNANLFSSRVQQAINTGIVTSKARRKNNSSLRTHMIVHTIMPTSEQYVAVCCKLVNKYPKLEDEQGNSFVSI